MSSAHQAMRGLLDSRRERHSLPKKFYGDAAFYDLDLDLLFGRCWVLAGFDCQIDAADFRVSRIPFDDGILSTTLDASYAVARPLAPVPFADIGQLRWHHYPSMFGHVYYDYAMFYRMLPAGPQRTLVTATWLVNADAQEGCDYDLSTLTQVWNATNDQDAVLSERNQLGINTDGYAPGPYNQVLERDVVKFVDWYCSSMRAALRSGVSA